MNRWARIVLVLSALSILAWTASGLLGWRVESDATLAVHTLVAFGALLALLLCQGWVMVFLAVSEHKIAALGTVAASELAEISRARRDASIAAVLVLVATTGQFASSSLTYPAHFHRLAHLVGGAVSVLLLAAAWGVETMALKRHGRAVSRADDAAPRAA